MIKQRRPCSVEGCDGLAVTRGWCKKHYSRWQRGGNPHEPLPEKQLGKPCWAEGCNRMVTPKGAKGLCTVHYQRMLRTGTPNGSTDPHPAERFFEKVEQDGECWRWTASEDGSGYGTFSAKSSRRRGHIVRAHIWSYEYFIGPVPTGLQLDHLCHDRSCELGVDCPHRRCVNPWHLEPVTPLVNTQRGCGQQRTHCPSGHAYDADNTYLHPKGAQICRRCMAAHRVRYDAKKKAA